MNDGTEPGGQHDLGACCICETHYGVTNILMIARRSPIPGRGWGCVVCDLPQDGAVAVLCDGCRELVEAGSNPIFVCRGWPATDGRVRYSDLDTPPFDHDDGIHRQRDEELAQRRG